MSYIDTETGAYPLHRRNIEQLNPNSSWPEDSFEPPARYALVVEADKPAHDEISQNVLEGAPTNIDGVWTQTWVVAPASASEIAERTERQHRITIASALLGDGTANYLRSHTPAEVQAYVQTNVTDLASAKVVLGKLAGIVALLARERLS